MTESFTKVKRLSKKKDIEYLLKNGKRSSDEFLTLYYKKSDILAVGLSITKGLKGAVKRNLLRRRLREILRKKRKNLKKDVMFIILAKPQALTLKYRELERSITILLSKEDLLE